VPCRRSTNAFKSGRWGGLTTGWTPKADQNRRKGLGTSRRLVLPSKRGSRETADPLGHADPLHEGQERAKDGRCRRGGTGVAHEPQGRAHLHRVDDLHRMRLFGGDEGRKQLRWGSRRMRRGMAPFYNSTPRRRMSGGDAIQPGEPQTIITKSGCSSSQTRRASSPSSASPITSIYSAERTMNLRPSPDYSWGIGEE
jgi:hypothetical protein